MSDQPIIEQREDGTVLINGVPFAQSKSPATERFGKWLVRKIGGGAEAVLKSANRHAKAVGRIVAFGAPLLAVGGAALGLPPGTVTAISTGAKVVTAILAGDLPSCE